MNRILEETTIKLKYSMIKTNSAGVFHATVYTVHLYFTPRKFVSGTRCPSSVLTITSLTDACASEVITVVLV